MSASNLFWTEREDTILTRMWHGGQSNADIADILGRSTCAVKKRACRLKLSKRPEVAPSPVPRKREYKRSHTQLMDKPIGYSPFDALHSARQDHRCSLHLLDLLREYAPGQTLGDAKAAYRQRCELDIPAGAEKPTIYVHSADRSYCGSPAATCAW